MSVSSRNASSAHWSTGLSAALAGVVLLVAYWQVPRLTAHLSRFGAFVCLATAIGLAAWGAVELLAAGLTVHPDRRARRIGESFERLRGSVSVSWLGVFLILIGIELLAATAWRSDSFVVQGIIAATGLAAIAWGGKEILSRLAPSAPTHAGRHRMTFTRPGVAYLIIMGVLFVGSLLGRNNLLMLVFALMAGPFVLNGWITFAMLRRNVLERTVPVRVMAGEVASVELALHNHKLWLSDWLMGAVEEVSDGREHLTAAVLFARVPPRGERRGTYQLRLMQRGRWRIGPATISTRFPLGLVERGLTFDDMAEILVYPRIGRLTPAWKRQFGAADELVHRQETRRGIFDDEFHGIREYRSGDNPRAIHWRTSARLGQVMVREFHQSRERNLLVLIDLWLPRRPEPADGDRVELAVSFAATICIEHMRQSRDSNLLAASAGETVSAWEGPSCPASMEPLLDTLALVQPGPTPDLQELFRRAAAKRTSTSRTVLITTRSRSGPGFAEWQEGISRQALGEWGGELQVIAATPDDLSRYFLWA